MAKIEIEIPDNNIDYDIQDAIIAFVRMASYHYQPEARKREELKIAEWLMQLKLFFDKTLISDTSLIREGFEKNAEEYLLCTDAYEVYAKELDSEMGIWRVGVNYLDTCCPVEIDICTMGQLRMFLKIEGLEIKGTC